jgi:hypothetical protein
LEYKDFQNSELQETIADVSFLGIFVIEIFLSDMREIAAASMIQSSILVTQSEHLFFSFLMPRSNTHRSDLGAAV